MPYGHEFYPQPRGNPPWCFCRRRDCPGWAAYLAWYQDHTGEQGEPGDQVTEAHSCLSKVIATLVSHYSALSGADVDLNTALELAAIDRTAGLCG